MRLTGAAVETAPRRARLTVLGAERPRWLVTDDRRHLHATTLTGRHADILVLLSRHPEGLSADHLAMLLDDKDLDVVTVRAEMSRLRKVIGAEYIDSRPYRLLVPITTDIGEVFDALARRRRRCARSTATRERCCRNRCRRRSRGCAPS